MRIPHWLLLFVFMLNLGLMFWSIAAPHKLLAVVSIALCVALPHVPTSKGDRA
jgi:hypothetical protein